jgi:hypothetical protein
MKRSLILGLLVAANLTLIARLILELPTPPARSDQTTTLDQPAIQQTNPAVRYDPTAPAQSLGTTPFERMYSQDPRTFAANLRSIGCPEQTVRDILLVEIGRRFRVEEEALRPTPADHVPFAWSANTSEARLLERRQQAASLARAKAELLREALGFEVPVPMATYAMTVAEQRFQESLESASPTERTATLRAHEAYWSQVVLLQEMTRGFWLPEDLAELERLKAERRLAIERASGP